MTYWLKPSLAIAVLVASAFLSPAIGTAPADPSPAGAALAPMERGPGGTDARLIEAQSEVGREAARSIAAWSDAFALMSMLPTPPQAARDLAPRQR